MLKESLLSLLSVILVGLVSVVGMYLRSYLAKVTHKLEIETEGIKNADTKKLAVEALDRINNLIETNVTAMEVTLVKEIKKEEGYTKEDLLAVATKVREDVLKQASTDIKQLAKREVLDLEQYIKFQIEVVLAKMKGQI